MRQPAIQPAHCRPGCAGGTAAPPTAHRICALWWSTRPGLNCTKRHDRGRDQHHREAAPRRPPAACASRATISASARTAERARRCASPAPPLRPEQRREHADRSPAAGRSGATSATPAARVRRCAAAWCRTTGAPAEQLAHRDQPHRVVGIAQPIESDGPGPARVAMTRKAVASSAKPSGVTTHRPSAGSLGNPFRIPPPPSPPPQRPSA